MLPLLLALCAFLTTPPDESPVPNCQTCPGCTPTTDPQDTDSEPGCGTVGISLLILEGECCRFMEVGTGALVCKTNRKCVVTITRSWTGITGQPEFCIYQGVEQRCSTPPAGGPNPATNTWNLACGDGYAWSISAACPEGGQISAFARGCCSDCGSSDPCQFGG